MAVAGQWQVGGCNWVVTFYAHSHHILLGFSHGKAAEQVGWFNSHVHGLVDHFLPF